MRQNRFPVVLFGLFCGICLFFLLPQRVMAASCPATDGGAGDDDGLVNGIITINGNATWTPTDGTTWDCSGLDVYVTNSATLTFSSDTTNGYYGWLSVDNVTIDSGSSISSNSKGCTFASGSSTNGYGPNGSNICTISTAGYGYSNGGGAGGYGGAGGAGVGASSGAGGTTYGSSIAPTFFGSSSGRNFFAATGSGGGVVRLDISETLTLNGTISANGGNGNTFGTNIATGGGSGGSVYITTGTFAGSTGTLTATGGNGANNTDADGGGG